MKRYVLSFICLFVSLFAIADERKSVEIKANESAPYEVELSNNCKLYISATKLANQNEANVSVEVENTGEYYHLFIFGRAFTEKDLKKNKPTSIRFDKKSYGATSRELRTCKSNEGEDLVQISPQQRSTFTFYGNVDNINNIELPLYIAKFKKKKFLCKAKYLIMQREIIALNVTVKAEEKPETDNLDRLTEAYESLMEELEEQSFCNNKKHSPSLAEQEEPFKAKIDEIKDEIAEIKSENNWRERSAKYQPYKELLAKLDDIDFKKFEKDCGKHKVPDPYPPHKCSYDNTSAEQMHSDIIRLYKNLDNGKISKSSAVDKARALKKAWSGGCPILKRKMDNASSTKSSAEEYYNSIINY